MEQQRKLLDALMGANRNGDPSASAKHFGDPDVCKYFLCGLCPNELFTNTKMDLGECDKLHSAPLKSDYEEAVQKGKDYGYAYELELYLEHFVNDCDRKIVRAQKRLEETEKEDSSQQIAAQIKELFAKAEELGSEGKVDESMMLIRQAEELKRKEVTPPAAPVVTGQELPPAGPSQQQKLRVCDICSAFLSIYDSDRRLADHFGGKLHLGYLQIREKLKESKEERLKREGQHRDRDRDRDRDRERVRRDREKDLKERDRDRDRDRDRKRDRRDRADERHRRR